MDNEFTIDEQPIPFVPGQTILEAAKAAGIYIPHLCFQPDFKRHGGCKLCTVLVNGRTQTACTHKAAVGQEVDVDTPELDAMRRSLVQMLFIEGNHFCPGCEKSGACQLQALGLRIRDAVAAFRRALSQQGRRLVASRRADRLQSLHPVRALRARKPRRRPQGGVRGRRTRTRRQTDHQLADRQARRQRLRRHRPRRDASVRSARSWSSASASRPRSATGRTTARRSAPRRNPASFRRFDERPRSREGQDPACDDVARRLLRLPHVVPRHRRAHCSSWRNFAEFDRSPLTDIKSLRSLRYRADRRRRLQRR